jgi:polyhydroxybutyrate depolymerase
LEETERTSWGDIGADEMQARFTRAGKLTGAIAKSWVSFWRSIVGHPLIAVVLASTPFAVSSAAEMKVEQLSIDGRTREYVLSAPASGRQLPTILALHGALLDAKRTMVSMGLEGLIDPERLVVVAPNAVAGQWNDGRLLAATLTWEADDVAFIRSLIGYLVDTGVSDPHRVYVTGFSNGGMMALRLICEAPDLIAGAGIIAASFPLELVERCNKPRPTPVLVMNGTADPIVPYAGGALAFGGGQVLSTDETINLLRTINRCTDNRKSDPLPHADPNDDSYVMISRWTNCAWGTPVVLYRIQGGGHRIPGHREGWPVLTNILLGKMNRDFEAAYALWNFFNDKKRVNLQAQ